MKKLMKNVAVLALAAAVAVGSVTGVSAAVKSPTSSLVLRMLLYQTEIQLIQRLTEQLKLE